MVEVINALYTEIETFGSLSSEKKKYNILKERLIDEVEKNILLKPNK